MTIKQNGGVFGRNPTFNDVTIEGQLTFDGDVDINSDLKVNGDLEVTGSVTADTHFASSDLAATISTSGSGGIVYFRPNGKGDTSGQVRVLYTGDVDVTGGNLIIGTSGKGIDFSATSGTGTSELLDDYEEGLHSPTITPTTSGTIALNPSFDTLSYTKVGRQVTLTGLLLVQTSGTSSPIGGIAISLPFASVNLTDRAGDSAVALQVSNVSSANCADFVGNIVEGQSVLTILLGDATTVQSDSAQQLVTNSAIALSVTYFTS